MDYQVVFDIGAAGFRDWWFPGTGLAFVLTTFLALRFRNTVEKTMPRFARGAGIPILFGFSLIWTAAASIATCGEYFSMRSALQNGRYQFVEGPVEDFKPMPYEGHAMESFRVRTSKFEYSDYVITAGFNKTQSHGGPIREGLKVRIYFVENTILRLEVER